MKRHHLRAIFSAHILVLLSLQTSCSPTKECLQGQPCPSQATKDSYFLTEINGKVPATDSAAAGTAMATGRKTEAGNISWQAGDPDNGKLETIAEILRREQGFALGIVSTVPFSHATPAAFTAHNISRNNAWDIAHEILFTTAPEVVIGGGYANKYFATALHDQQGSSTDRDQNGFNDDFDSFRNGTHATNYHYVERRKGQDGGKVLLEAAAGVQLDNGDKLFALFGTPAGNFSYYDVQDTPGAPQLKQKEMEDPTLAEVTTATLKLLSQDPDGFFVMIEQGDIDWSNHANDYQKMIGGVYDLHQAVLSAEASIDNNRNGMSWQNTLVIVTSDHANSYLQSHTVLGKGDLPLQQGEPKQFTYPDGDITYATTGHTNQLVTVAARGAGSGLFEEYAGQWYPGTRSIDNTHLHAIMLQAAREHGARHIILFIGDGMHLEHERAASRYLYGKDDALAWRGWGDRSNGWSGYAATWDIDTYNRYAAQVGQPGFEQDAFNPTLGYNPQSGGAVP